MNIGRRRRARNASCVIERVTSAVGLAVDEITTSASCRCVGDVVETDREAVELGCELACVVDAAIGDDHAAETVGVQVPRNERDHVAGADEQRRALLEAREDRARHRNRRRGDRDGVGADLRLGPHALRDRECRLEQAIEQRPGRAGVLRGAVGILELAEDLRLAEHHRVESRRDRERVRHGPGIRAGHRVRAGCWHRGCGSARANGPSSGGPGSATQ